MILLYLLIWIFSWSFEQFKFFPKVQKMGQKYMYGFYLELNIKSEKDK